MIGYQTQVQRPTVAQQHTLIQRVSSLLASGLVVTALGAWLFRDAYGIVLPAFLLTFALIFVMQWTARRPGINVFVFYIFSFVEGAALGPGLALYARTLPNGPNLIWESFLLTAITVGGVGAYAYTCGRDFSFLGRGLIWGLVGLIVVGLLFCFISPLTLAGNGPMIVLGFEVAVVAVFVGFLLYDFSRIRLRYSPDDYIMATVAVYLDFVNLFLAILRILAILQGGGGSSRRR